MRILQSSILRALCAIVVGYLLVMYRTDMVQWITIAIGTMFFLTGVVSEDAYYTEKRKIEKTAEQLSTMAELRGGQGTPHNRMNIKKAMSPSFPIVGLGSMILGVILAAMPGSFIKGVMYVLSAIIILGSLNLFFNFANIRKIIRVPFMFWLFPSILAVAGIYMMAKPMEISALPFRILGWCLMLYGVVEIISGIKIFQVQKHYENEQKRVEAAYKEAQASMTEDAIVLDKKEKGI